MNVQLWLARHGSTDWSDAGRFLGWKDVRLNRAGRLQARRLGKNLAGVSLASRWSSDLIRASETARIAVGHAALDPRLRELDFGLLEGKTWSECTTEVQQELLGFDEFRAPGGESVAALKQRVLVFIDSLQDGDHVLFTHGGVIRLLLREVSVDRPVAPGELIRVRWRR